MYHHVQTGAGESCSSDSGFGKETKNRVHWQAAERAGILLKDQLRGCLEWVT